ncbi:MAG: cupin-like domain-containing protein [Pseudomonadota bacterium]
MEFSLKTSAILRLLDETKTNKQWYNDRGLLAGYHSINIDGQEFKGQRDPKMRLAKVDYDFNGKRVLDVGCSNGGLLQCLSSEIEFGVGIDFNSKCINAANALKAAKGFSNLHFYCFDLDKEDLSLISSFLLGQQIDICLFLNISLWVKNWKNSFRFCAEISQTILFEAHGSDTQRKEQVEFIQSIYKTVHPLSLESNDDPTYSAREMYICSEKVNQLLARENSMEQKISDSFKKAFPLEPLFAINCIPGTQGSYVAEVNDTYIVKLPKTDIDRAKVKNEKNILDFFKNKLDITIPEFICGYSANSETIFKYTKILGSVLTKQTYENLNETQKQRITQQIATIVCQFHETSLNEITYMGIDVPSAWELSLDVIEEQHSNSGIRSIDSILKDVLRNHSLLSVPDSDKVVGHFDLHGGNILVSEDFANINGLIDFGNFAVGDLHKDLAKLYFISPDCADRVFSIYEQQMARSLNRLLIKHYITIYYLDLLARLKLRNEMDAYHNWLRAFNAWYDYLVKEKAIAKLEAAKPISTIPENWKQWIAANLMRDAQISTLQSILQKQGFSDVDIYAELLTAEKHPYITAAKEINKTLKKRNWLLNTIDSLAALDSRYSTNIEKIEVPAFDIFIKNYYSKHLPVVLTGGMDKWPALNKWTPEYLSTHFGHVDVEVQFGRASDPQYERNSLAHKKIIKLSEFSSMITEVEASNDFYMTANNAAQNMNGLAALFDDVADFGHGYREQANIKSRNLLWFGPKGTYTPMHHDLINNMLVQIYGRKKVTLIPALQVPFMYNDTGVYTAATYPNYDREKYPMLEKVTPIEFILEPGDALFIPIGWWHSVESLSISIGLTFNNFNTSNAYSDAFPK